VNLKKLATFSLLLFVVVSVAYFVYDEIRLSSVVQKPEAGSTDSGDPALPKDYVTLYYFHGTIRCQTCLDMESNAKKVLETYFSSRVEDGTLRWQVVNIDLPENYHYVDEYIIMYNTLVINSYKHHDAGEWKELWKAWDLSEKGEEYIQYVRDEVASFLEVN
jgi:hypothetical protein